MHTENNIQDATLWMDFISGSEEAYAAIYKKHSTQMYVYGLSYTSDSELVEDGIQDVFMKIFERRKTLKPVHNLRIYLFVCLRNSINTILAKQKIKLDRSIDDISYIADDVAIEDHITHTESDQLLQQQISRILSLLTLRQREVVHLRFIESMEIKEISLVMNMNYQSVQNLLQRSIKKIKENLALFDFPWEK